MESISVQPSISLSSIQVEQDMKHKANQGTQCTLPSLNSIQNQDKHQPSQQQVKTQKPTYILPKINIKYDLQFPKKNDFKFQRNHLLFLDMLKLQMRSKQPCKKLKKISITRLPKLQYRNFNGDNIKKSQQQLGVINALQPKSQNQKILPFSNQNDSQKLNQTNVVLFNNQQNKFQFKEKLSDSKLMQVPQNGKILQGHVRISSKKLHKFSQKKFKSRLLNKNKVR